MQVSDSVARSIAMVFHPLAMNSSRHWRQLLRLSGGVHPSGRLRTATITAISPLWAPFRWAERLRYERRVANVQITEPPVFILGHWRTGTTLVHYLMSQDPAFGFVSLMQTMAPALFLAGRRVLRPIMNPIVFDKRPMDNMELSLDLPQEEEYALCNLCPYSFYVGLYFPQRMSDLFRKYVLFEDISEEEIGEWKRVYLGVLKKATQFCQGRPMLLKNPVNTARIRLLLELFPNAKFIHVYRNPYVVYKSTQRFYRSVLKLVGLQELTEAELDRNILDFYRQMMQRYFDEKHLIPKGHLSEVRYEDLEKRPIGELERVYAELSLPGWETARPRIESYLATLDDYAKNHHAYTLRDIDRVQQEWGFALDRWGYAPPSGAPPRDEQRPLCSAVG